MTRNAGGASIHQALASVEMNLDTEADDGWGADADLMNDEDDENDDMKDALDVVSAEGES